MSRTMTDTRPILLWFRRDLRLSDHPALHEAASSGRPVIPVFLNDEGVDALGAAPMMRIGMAAEALARSLRALGSRLTFRQGPAGEALGLLAEQTGAGAVWLTRHHDPVSRATDRSVKAALAGSGVELRAFPGQLLHDPDALRTGTGKPFRVYTPFRKALMRTDPGEPLPAPSRLLAPERWPDSDALEDWRLAAPMRRGAEIVARWQRPGEAGARERLEQFMAKRLDAYAEARDFPGRDGSSRLSENLTVGEIGPRVLWALGREALGRGSPGAERFLGEVAWRDFCYHLLWHSPEIATEHWKPGFTGFPWQREGPLATAWTRGMTGIPFVDAGMREMWVTGRMNNRARMIAASLLTKQMLTDWRLGQAVFADCLTDWDPANNAVNWQWVAGSGPDASPFFRIYNPETQARDYDPEGAYLRAWIAEGRAEPSDTALDFFRVVPRSWRLSPDEPYPEPVIDLAQARAAALAAFRSRIRDREDQVADGA
jgi:deoxyribodipyrimidine photo-lyase